MRIGIDVRLWKEKGLGRYIQNLVRELLAVNSEDKYILFGLEEDLNEIKNCPGSNYEVVVANVRWYSFREQMVMPMLFVRARLDVLHIPHFNAPLLYPGKMIMTLHDLTHLHFRDLSASKYPAWIYAIKHVFFMIVLKINLWKCSRIIAVSKYVQHDLQRSLKVPGSKIKVIYEAASESAKFKPTEVSVLLSEYNVTKRYFYYIGNAYPHKNLEMLLKAFKEFNRIHSDSQLVLSGGDSFFWPRLKKYAVYNYLSENVIFTDKISDREKDIFMSAACAYVFPSKSEGFGLPILEAMSCECPVLAARMTSLPEIGGEACLYFEPTTEDIVEKMLLVWENNQVRQELIEKGRVRVKDFSWLKTAMETSSIYKAIAD